MIDDAREREAAANLALLATGGDPSVLTAAVTAAVTASRPPLLALPLQTPSPLASPAASVSSSTSATRIPAMQSSLASPAKVPPSQSLTLSPSPAACSPVPCAPPILVAAAVDSPVNHDEASLDGEQFEPILSDEDIEDDNQVGNGSSFQSFTVVAVLNKYFCL